MSKERKVVGIIPARMGASRFPGKPLAKILDLPMIEHVRRRALLAESIDEVYVATCDQEIFDVVVRMGGGAIMTADTHERCTDRVQEAMEKLDGEIVVILQGDEPLFMPEMVDMMISPMLKDKDLLCTNLISKIHDEEDLKDVDIVKAVMDKNNFMLYYSRAAIPYLRVRQGCALYRQTGLSAFTKDFLNQFSNLEPTPLEVAESVDFLRILENRFLILGVVYDSQTVGVDQPENIAIIEKILTEDKKQNKIYQTILK